MPGGTVLIPPRVRHWAVGRMPILNVVVPPSTRPTSGSTEDGTSVDRYTPGRVRVRETGMRSRTRRVRPQRASRRAPRSDLRERSRHASRITTTDVPPFHLGLDPGPLIRVEVGLVLGLAQRYLGFSQLLKKQAESRLRQSPGVLGINFPLQQPSSLECLPSVRD
jgi:hypothetical protein